MKTTSHVSGLACVAIASLVAMPAARALDASCKPIVDATARLADTPNHQYMSMSGDSQTKGETIVSGGVLYVMAEGHWMRTQLSPQQVMQDSIKQMNDTNSVCARVRDEAVAGEGATVYEIKNRSNVSTTDSLFWISASRGLPLRGESDVNGKTGKTHIAIRYDYANVQPPAGAS